MRPAPSSPSASRPIPSPSRPSPTPTPNRSRGYDSRPPSAGVGPRAQIYFRKAQSCLTRGDLGGALFNLRLAAAADPTSALIRVALAEVQAEVMGGKKP